MSQEIPSIRGVKEMRLLEEAQPLLGGLVGVSSRANIRSVSKARIGRGARATPSSQDVNRRGLS